MSARVVLGEAPSTPSQIAAIAAGAELALAPVAAARVDAARAIVESALRGDRKIYGLNTRLGAGRDEQLAPNELEAFQQQVIDNHRGGTGPALSPSEVRAILAARIAVIANGGAGVRLSTLDALVALLNSGVQPLVRARGSVGAADLSHLAAIVGVASGRGFAHWRRERMPAAAALRAAGLEPLLLAPHEALAVLSGNPYSIGVGALALERLDAFASGADAAVALTLEALGRAGGGNLGAFSPEIQGARGGTGQAASAARVLELLDGRHLGDGERAVTVQDPLSLRTVPQLHGALREQTDRLRAELELELAARSENPLVLPTAGAGPGEMISGGNFLILPLALCYEAQRLVLAHVAAASERRTAQLSEQLRAHRATGASVLAGLSWYAAADALAELRQLAAPVSLGAGTLSGVEDVSTFAPAALRLLQRSLALAREVFAIEALHAAELLRVQQAPRKSLQRYGVGTAPLIAELTAALESPERETATLVERAAVTLFGEGGEQPV